MGFFGTYLYDGRHWTLHDPERAPGVSEPWLLIDIHDSDIATVTYSPPGPGSGVAFLGFTPRTYFEDDTASEPTDVAGEAAGLAAWWATTHLGSTYDMRASKASELIAFLAADEPSDEADEVDEADVFVEIKTGRFLAALGIPAPDDLPIA